MSQSSGFGFFQRFSKFRNGKRQTDVQSCPATTNVTPPHEVNLEVISEESLENILPSGREASKWAANGQEATPGFAEVCQSLVAKPWS